MRRLFPELDESAWPTYGTVEQDAVYLMTRRRAIRLPRVPPPFRNHGNHVTSVAQLGRWLSQRAEQAGVYILPETTAYKLLVKDGAVRGVRTGDKGREVQKRLDRVIHMIGWPLRYAAKYREFGASFIYPMGEDKVSLGLVVGLDYCDATLSVHDLLQELQTHPFVRSFLGGGRRVAWGAKTIPAGGYWSAPQRLWAPGLVIAGDAAGMVNVPKLKGVHLAMHAGMLAAEAILDALKRGSTEDLSAYQQTIRASVIERDLYRSRNMRQPFTKGFMVGAAIANVMELSGGRFPGGHWHTGDDAAVGVFIGERDKRYPKPDRRLTFDKLGVFLSGNTTRDDAPNHIRIERNVPLAVGLMGRHQQREQTRPRPAHTVQLRPMWRDHREGRASHAGRGRRRTELPDHVRAQSGPLRRPALARGSRFAAGRAPTPSRRTQSTRCP